VRCAAGSRIVGQGKLLRSLRSLLARVERFAVHRARTHEEHVWAACLSDRLDGAFRDALTPQARASLAAVDRRLDISRKRTQPGAHNRLRVIGSRCTDGALILTRTL
jgi:hypothetical protein